MPLPGILGGSKPSRSIFFLRFLEPKKKQGKIGNFGEISEKVIIFGKISEKVRKIWKNWKNEISVEISYRSPPITDISPIFRSKYRKFCSLAIGDLVVILHDCLFVSDSRKNLVSVSKLCNDSYSISFNKTFVSIKRK